jgi:hypothetical protein
MKTAASLLSAVLGIVLPGIALTQQQSVAASIGMFVYPSGGQTPEQQSKDEQECYAWAKQTSGIDPAAPAPGPAQVEQQDTAGAAAGGALRGAARAAVIADIADEDTSEWAAAGAVAGASRGARSARARNAQATQQAQQQQQQAAQQQTQTFKNAFSACVEGRNYTIK